MPPHSLASTQGNPLLPTRDSTSLFETILRTKPLPPGTLNWPLASQVLCAPGALLTQLERDGFINDNPNVVLDAMDTLTDLYEAAADVWVQQDLLEDAIHLFISRRDASARRLLQHFKELEDYSAVKQAARHLIPINDITYSRDFIVTPTFPNVDARDLARMITNYSPCIVCQGTDADYHRTIDCSHYRC
ncbi:hypothetical protein EVJ58_g9859, partial [Rhodofomes roseus]